MKRRSGWKMILMLMAAVLLLSMNVYAKKIEKVHSYYPVARLKQTVKAGKKTIKAGERVAVIKKGASVCLVQYQHKCYKVKTSVLGIYGWITRGKKRYSDDTAEAFVNKKGFSSSTKYLIWISTYTQHLYVFSGKRGHWKLIEHETCGTGKFGHETVMGQCTVTFKRPWVYFNQSIGQGGYYCLRIRGGFIHSWPYNIGWAQAHNDKRLIWSREHYGKPVSSGCARVNIKFAKWLYDRISIGTKIVVY